MHNFIPSTGGLDPQDILLAHGDFCSRLLQTRDLQQVLARSPYPLSPPQTPERGSESSQRPQGASEGRKSPLAAGRAPTQSIGWPMTTERQSQLAAVPTRKTRSRCFKIVSDIFILFHIPEHFACMCMPVTEEVR